VRRSTGSSTSSLLEREIGRILQRSRKQVQDKWNKMKDKFTQEKKKIGQIGSASSDWIPWYEIFDNIYGGTTQINGLPHGVDQIMRTKHEEVEILSDDEVLVAPTATPLFPCNKACHNSQASCQVNKSANKRKKKLTIGDSAITNAIKYGFDGVQESKKMKMQMTKEITSQILESEQQERQLIFSKPTANGILHCRGLQTKRCSKWFLVDLHWFLFLCECNVEMIIV
jgi:hypothetical protein